MALQLIIAVPRLIIDLLSIFQKCGVLPIQNFVKVISAICVYTCLNGVVSDYRKNIFQEVSDNQQDYV